MDINRPGAPLAAAEPTEAPLDIGSADAAAPLDIVSAVEAAEKAAGQAVDALADHATHIGRLPAPLQAPMADALRYRLLKAGVTL